MSQPKHKRGDVHPETGLFFFGMVPWRASDGTKRWRERWVPWSIIEAYRAYHKAYEKRWRFENPEIRKQRDRDRAALAKPQRAARNRRWKRLNKKRRAELDQRYTRNRRQRDPLFRLRERVSAAIRRALSSKGATKTTSAEVILGCSFQQFREHIARQFTDGMCWQRIGEIEIDHRVPIAMATTESDVLFLCHYTNLQPRWKADNRAKGSKLLTS